MENSMRQLKIVYVTQDMMAMEYNARRSDKQR